MLLYFYNYKIYTSTTITPIPFKKYFDFRSFIILIIYKMNIKNRFYNMYNKLFFTNFRIVIMYFTEND